VRKLPLENPFNNLYEVKWVGAAAEEREEAKQVKQRADHETGLSPDLSREINSLCAGQGFGERQHSPA
jgi:hypothetical protein